MFRPLLGVTVLLGLNKSGSSIKFSRDSFLLDIFDYILICKLCPSLTGTYPGGFRSQYTGMGAQIQ